MADSEVTNLPDTLYIHGKQTGKMTHHRKIDLSMFRDEDEDDLVIAPKAKVNPLDLAQRKSKSNKSSVKSN